MTNQIERTVRFYRACTNLSGGSDEPWAPKSAIAKLGAAIQKNGPKVKDHQGQEMLFLDADSTVPNPRVRIAKSRFLDLPLKQKGTTVKQLGFGDDEALAEVTHMVFFPDRIVGIEYNHFGPGRASIASAIRAMDRASLGELHFAALFSTPTLAKVARGFEEIFSFDAKLALSQMGQTARDDAMDTTSYLRQSASEVGGEYIKISIGIDGRRGKLKNLPAFLKRMMSSLRGSDNMEALSLRGRSKASGLIESEDIFRSFLTKKEWMVALGDKTKAVRAASAYAAILGAHKAMKSELKKAVALY